MVWNRRITVIFSVTVFFLLYQNCSPNHFDDGKISDLVQGIRNPDGQVFDGKLRILHHLVDGFTCEGRLAPESILIRDSEVSWHWIQNTPEKCDAHEKDLADGVVYDEATKIATYNGFTYVPPRPYNVMASEDPNLPDVNPKDGVCADANGSCSLQAAMDQAGATSLTEAVTINIPAGQYSLKKQLDLHLSEASNSVSVRGQDPQSTVLDGGSAVPHLIIRSLASSVVSVENLTLQNGSDPQAIYGSSIQISSTSPYDAPIPAPNAVVSISNCVFKNNKNSPGVVAAYPQSGTLQIHRSQFLNNQDNAVRGDSINGLLIEDTYFADNGGRGVALSKNSGSVLIRRSSFTGNYEALNFIECHNCVLENISVYRNFASGLVLQQTGAVDNSLNLVIQQSTFLDNVLQPYPGLSRSNLSLLFEDNSQFVTMTNSIVAMSAVGSVPNCVAWGTYGRNIQATNSLFSDNSCSVSGTGNVIADPLLASAADNGGWTPTLLPSPGSPAIDSGSNANCTPLDQRGFPRPSANGRCDMGSVEIQ